MKEILKIVVLFFFWIQILALQSCALGIVQMDSNNFRLLKNGTNIRAVHYQAPEFIVNSTSQLIMSSAFGGIAGGAGTGPAGAAATGATSATAGGQRLKQSDLLGDPTPKIKRDFMAVVASDLGLGEVQDVADSIPSATVEDLKKTFRDGFIFAFHTIRWDVEPYPTALRYYRLIFWHQGKLVRLADATVLWNGVCKYEEKEPKEKWPKLKELKADNWALLKMKVEQAGDYCTKELLSQFRGK